MPQLDVSAFSPQIIWLIITFVILYALMAKVALPRIGNILEQRQARIDDNLDTAQNLRRETNADSEAYDHAIAGAHDKARQAIQKTTKEISTETTRRQEELGIRLSAELKAAEDRIVDAKAAAMESIHQSAIGIASEAIKMLIGEKPSESTVRSAISSALGEPSKEIKK